MDREVAVLDMHGQDSRGARAGMPVRLPTLHVRVLRDRATPIVILVGEVDLVDIGKLDNCLAALSGTVIVDLNAVTFLGSTGLRSFVVAQKRLHADGGKLLLRSPKDHVRRVLEITGLDYMLIGTASADGMPAA
jgi:anti-sigma B factor antagonist